MGFKLVRVEIPTGTSWDPTGTSSIDILGEKGWVFDQENVEKGLKVG